MQRSMFECLESREMFSVSLATSFASTPATPMAAIHATPFKKAAVSFVSSYSGTLSIPGLKYTKSVVLAIKTSGKHGFTGTLTATGITVNVAGVLTAKGFTITLSGSNPASPMIGAGTGTFDAGYQHMTLTMGFKPGKKVYAGTVTVARANATPVLPSLLGSYSGTMDIPAVAHYKSAVLNIASQSTSGAFTGTLTADGQVSVNVSGTVAANRTFTISVVTPPNTNHPGGPINGTGTGTLDATGKIVAIHLTFSAYGTTFPGTVSVSKP